MSAFFKSTAVLFLVVFVLSGINSACARETLARLCEEAAPFTVSVQIGDRVLGSGIIVNEDKEWYVLTLLSIAGEKGPWKIVLHNGKSLEASAFGIKKELNIAVLKIENTKGLTGAKLGEFDALKIGQKVLAVGFPAGKDILATFGIVSLINREDDPEKPFQDYILTDALVNPANAGGPLIDMEGRVIGICALSRPKDTSRPIQKIQKFQKFRKRRPVRLVSSNVLGCAIPAKYFRNIITGIGPGENAVTLKEMGVSNIQDISRTLMDKLKIKSDKGAWVGSVKNKGIAGAAGMKSGDVVLRYNGETVKNAKHLKKLIAKTLYGSKVLVTVIRLEEGEVVVKKLIIPVEKAESSSGVGYDGVPPGYSFIMNSAEFEQDNLNRMVSVALPKVLSIGGKGGTSAIVLFLDFVGADQDVRYLVTDCEARGSSVRIPPVNEEDKERGYSEVKGEVVGVDKNRGVRVIRIKQKGAPGAWTGGYAKPGEVGGALFVIGGSLGGSGAATAGILVSKQSYGLLADYPYFLLTDAAIMKSGAGAAVVNDKGRLVGMCVRRSSPGSKFNGLGLVLPISELKYAATEIILYGEVRRGRLGVDKLRALNAAEREQLELDVGAGLYVGEVIKGGPADKARIKEGTVILRYNGRLVRSVKQFQTLVETTHIGEKVEIEVIREGKRKTITVRVGERKRAIDKG